MNSSSPTADGWMPVAERRSDGAVSQKLILATYLILCFISIIPFVAIAHPPIVDFANHAARLDLACHRNDPAVAAMYRYQLGIIPNLAADLVNFPLCGAVGPTAVLKGVTAGSLLLIYFSGWLIQRKLFGRANAFLFLLPALAFNIVTTMGYINFLAGVAVVCLMVALAIGREKEFRTMLLIGNIGGLVLFFCHIFALAIGLVLFFGLMLRGERLSPGRLVEAGFRTLALFALPLILIPLVPSDGHDFSFGYQQKIRVLIAPFMANRSLGLYGLILLAPLCLALKDKDARLHELFRVPLALVALYVLLAPSHVHDAVDIDARSVVPLAYLFFAALAPGGRERGLTIALAALAAAFAAFQLWSIAAVWQPYSRQMAEFRAATTVLPADAKVLPVRDFEGPNVVAAPMGYFNVTSYATLDRRIFNPLEFTGVGMQPLSATPAFAAIDTPAGPPFSAEIANRLATPDADLQRRAPELATRFALRWPHTYDYVIYYHFGRPRNFNPKVLSEVRSGSFFTIYKIKKPAN